jgi:phage shock protein C
MDDSFSPESTTGTQGQPRNLRRSSTDSVIGGVAGGLGHYFALDPVLVRIAFVLLVLAGGSGILLYIVLWIVIPEATPDEDVAAVAGDRRELGGLIVGGALVVIGAIILLRRVVPWFDSQVVWAVLLITLGGYILVKGVRR